MVHPETEPPELPVLSAVPELAEALARSGTAVLVAPPGTGKTTAVPPALADRGGRIVVVVPRRMAARSAARRMATNAGEPVGERFGYSVRDDRSVSASTVVEVVTPGLLLRRIQADPELPGTTTVVLDEFHERSVDQDLLLALLLDARQALREDLRVVVMSATLDVAAVSSLLGDSTPVITVESSLHPVTTHWRPGSVHEPITRRVAEVVLEALGSTEGDLLVFLPGRAEIAATARILAGGLGEDVTTLELHASLPARRQDEVLSGAASGRRRIILATAVAETSLTVPGVRVVIDSGLRRYQQVNPATGLPSLRTAAVSISGADQRRGRAAREAPGVCFRLWARREEELRRKHDPPEITVAELSSLLLTTSLWGASSPHELSWLDPPPPGALQRAEILLEELGALDGSGRPTGLGRSLGEFGFHPRMAAIAVHSTQLGAPEVGARVLAALDSTARSAVDLAVQVREIAAGATDATSRRSVRQWEKRVERLARQLGHDRAGQDRGRRRGSAGTSTPEENGVPDTRAASDTDAVVAAVVLAGYADRLARRRDGRGDTYLMRQGGEATLPRDAGHLTGAEWLVVLDVDARRDTPGAGRIHSAVAVGRRHLEELLAQADRAGQIELQEAHDWDPADGSTATTTTRRLGAIALEVTRRRSIEAEALAAEVVERVRADGPSALRAWKELGALRARLGFLDALGIGGPWPDLCAEAVAETAAEWVPTLVAGATTIPAGSGSGRAGEIRGFDARPGELASALLSDLSHHHRRVLDREAPSRWLHPDGRGFRLVYGSVDRDPASVLLAVRLQELLGVDEHPTVGRGIPITVELLSPAGRPLQRTVDLPGFWRGSYAQVRSEMRGRYPKHDWPERPWEAPPAGRSRNRRRTGGGP